MTSQPIVPSEPAASSVNEARAHCQKKLIDLVTQFTSVRFACVSTADGRVYAFAGPPSETAPQRVAALTSAHLALSESFSKETLRGRCNYATVSTQEGTLVSVRIPSTRGSFIFSLGTDASEIMAMALRIALDAATHLGALINTSLIDTPQ